MAPDLRKDEIDSSLVTRSPAWRGALLCKSSFGVTGAVIGSDIVDMKDD